MQCNHLTELWVFNASEHLEQILANNNLLSSLGPLPPSLQVLNLEWNRLQRLPDLVGRPKLESLNVAHNLLEDLPPLDNPELHQLDVFGNRLHELPCLHALPRLSVLDAGGNYLRELPQLQNLTSDLHVLCVGDNQLEVLPDLSTIRSLYVLGCEGNSFPQRPRILGRPWKVVPTVCLIFVCCVCGSKVKAVVGELCRPGFRLGFGQAFAIIRFGAAAHKRWLIYGRTHPGSQHKDFQSLRNFQQESAHPRPPSPCREPKKSNA